MKWEVHKFGGASLSSPEGFPRLLEILKQRTNQANILLVVSAIGKTTNSLELVWSGAQPQADAAKKNTELTHLNTCRVLLKSESETGLNQLLERIQSPIEATDQAYDSLVSVGEKCSSFLVVEYLNQHGLSAVLLPAEAAIRTDSTWRNAQVDRQKTKDLIRTSMHRIQQESPNAIVVTQGFLGANAHGQTTTLGREGSDYSAALFANALEANAMFIWKDVPGVMSGDPRIWAEAVKLNALSYDDATDMAYYGASVIHPKTMLPLKEAGIPLHVKSYDAPGASGTLIGPTGDIQAVRMMKTQQTQIEITAQPGHFAVEKALPVLINLCAEYQCLINMLQHSASHVIACIEAPAARLELLANSLQTKGLSPILSTGLILLTLRDAPHELPHIPNVKAAVVMTQTLGRDRRFLLKPTSNA